MVNKSSFLKQRFSKLTIHKELKVKNVYPYFKRVALIQDSSFIMDGREVLMFGSNSYLGLGNHPKVKKAAKNAIDKYGTSCSGSRFLNGTLDLHVQLEEMLAAFLKKDEAIVFSTGFQTNLGAISCLTGRNDYLILDEKDHASIFDGARLSFSKLLKYKHNDMASLEQQLRPLPTNCVKLIVVDGVFSMEGDIVKLPEIVGLSKKYGATIMVDDAHTIGVIGQNGAGTGSYFGLENEVDFIAGTFSKSLASIGGYVAGDKAAIEFMKHSARSFMFSASIPPASVASVIAALGIIQDEPERLEKLWENTNYTFNGLRVLGYDIGKSVYPIIPIYVRDDNKTFKWAKLLFDEGIYVNPVIYPGVKKGDAILRLSILATHTYKQIDTLLEKLAKTQTLLN